MKNLIKFFAFSMSFISLLITSCNNEPKSAPEIEFKTYSFNDEIHLFGNENYPSCELDISVLAPQDSIYFENLRSIMLKTYFDSLYQINTNIDDLLFQSAQAFATDFKEQETYLMQDTLDIGLSMNWQIIVQNDIVFQNQRFISFMKELFAYTGGAHGNTNRFYYTFDLNNQELLTAEKLFVEQKYAGIIELQKQSLKKMGEDLSGFWLEGLKCDRNFYIEETGIVFYYDQYEIASYAAGPISIFISFDEIKPFLKQPELFKYY